MGCRIIIFGIPHSAVWEKDLDMFIFGRRGVVVITTEQLHSSKPEFTACQRFGMVNHTFRRSTIPQKQLNSSSFANKHVLQNNCLNKI